MADKVNFELVSPERLLVSDQFDMVVIPGGDGDFGVLPDHAPLISTIRAGVIEIHEGGSIAHRVFVGGGFSEVMPDRCTVLAEDAVMIADIDRTDVEQQIRDAELTARDAESEEARARAQARVEMLHAMLAAA
ncbi:MAG: F0F1 ATP synthase subunit epsilon [Rhodospirillaceae bacterium]|jgi:F-type H+-transporting ATPase subunit epsilon|nr:F0F1 ATP synthase subunit epsilon [Rhodospirillaceae bacterium]MBT6508816.1 F0F1 ATP synthase subunit epsilon [Rhodospirillaceae bacterium]MBT7647142.1 F0F1 ATP synthase subunit epsilon [Rhodospirillaceae bacterium]